MKCPECGVWNRASQPHCVRCGAPLNIDEASRNTWKDTLKDSGASTTYLRADEFGLTDQTPEPRDALAEEMQDLKRRKQRGAELQERLRSESPEPSSRVVVTEKTEDTPTTVRKTIVLEQETEAGQRARRESEMRSRVRYMDEHGTFVESRVYDPLVPEAFRNRDDSVPRRSDRYLPRKKHTFLRTLLILAVLVVLLGGGYQAVHHFFLSDAATVRENPPGVIISAAFIDDLAAHTVMIPGNEGSTIYIRELHASYVVSDGFATVEIPDHVWYDNLEGSLDETMDVTLTPFLKSSSGRQTPMDPITYTITIPLSKIELDTPATTRTTVSTSMATIKIIVRPGSHVTVNGDDYSDTVSSQTGEMVYNATVQPIGDNTYTFVVRSQYCRDNTLTVVFYRAKQDIPLDLAVGTYGTTDKKNMKVYAKTLPGAYVEVLTPYTDLYINDLDTTGDFYFYAVFDHIGDNTISIRASVDGKTPSQVDHVVYYLPPPDEYTTKAWPLSADGYAELLSNMTARAKNQQIYEVKGVVQYSISDKPQMVVINTSEDGKSQPVVVENYTKTKWEVGKYYRLFADAYSTYNGMPYLNARYTYP